MPCGFRHEEAIREFSARSWREFLNCSRLVSLKHARTDNRALWKCCSAKCIIVRMQAAQVWGGCRTCVIPMVIDCCRNGAQAFQKEKGRAG